MNEQLEYVRQYQILYTIIFCAFFIKGWYYLTLISGSIVLILTIWEIIGGMLENE